MVKINLKVTRFYRVTEIRTKLIEVKKRELKVGQFTNRKMLEVNSAGDDVRLKMLRSLDPRKYVRFPDLTENFLLEQRPAELLASRGTIRNCCCYYY